jgi:hypothetical protein
VVSNQEIETVFMQCLPALRPVFGGVHSEAGPNQHSGIDLADGSVVLDHEDTLRSIHWDSRWGDKGFDAAILKEGVHISGLRSAHRIMTLRPRVWATYYGVIKIDYTE